MDLRLSRLSRVPRLYRFRLYRPRAGRTSEARLSSPVPCGLSFKPRQSQQALMEIALEKNELRVLTERSTADHERVRLEGAVGDGASRQSRNIVEAQRDDREPRKDLA